jgi:hypothetical protein
MRTCTGGSTCGFVMPYVSATDCRGNGVTAEIGGRLFASDILTGVSIFLSAAGSGVGGECCCGTVFFDKADEGVF